ncbi:hypothetical protein BWZ20_10990 [Winogradskyella sp. J14-2]|uniref:TonB-dependent receptor n=1 Tax=Winogradskyella sp. J14-2 TaxID=1936080 RepID=UPI000972CD61|nr:TonB-dependent receptor [Winogradskyella sp. J14-2]APY08793.1 hypothetical protein BWZ20_10990 [Winogradskyella sp. J14-2]
MSRTKIYIFCFILYISYSLNLKGQTELQNISISTVLEKITKQHSVTFNYESSLLKDIVVVPLPKELSISKKLKKLEEQTNLVFEKVSNYVYTISKTLSICGFITDSETQLAIENVTIYGKSAYTISDENGYFEIELKSKNELLTIRHLGFQTIEREASFFNLEDCATITLLMQEEIIAPVLIETYLVKGINKRQDWTTSIDYKRFSLLPGLIESDVLQTVQALPGILSIDETVSNINIRGGSHDQTLMLWDDIKMYQTGHFFGLISSFNPLMTQKASIINNGSDVALTDGVSGTLLIKTEDQIDSKFNGVFGINFLNAELFSNIPIGRKSSLQLASRKSLDDLVRTPTYEVYFDRITQETEAETNVDNVTNSDRDFDFHDAALRWLYQPSDKDYLRLNFILINNNLSFDENAVINNSNQARQSSASQTSTAFGLNYKRLWNDKLSSDINIYNTDYKLNAVNANILEQQRFLQENSVSETSIKLNNRLEHNNLAYNLGYQFTETEVINLNDIDLPRFVRRDEEVLHEHAIFGQAWFKNQSNTVSIRGGIRGNFLAQFSKLIIEPRLSIRTAINQHIQIEAQGEFKHQSTSQIINFQNDFLGIERRRWQLTENDSIPIIQSKQASFGVTYKNNNWLLDAKGFYKEVDGITTQSQSFTTKYEFTREKGSYTAYGLELLLRKNIKHFNTWLSYSYINNTYTFKMLDEIEFPSNFDITHSLTFGTTYSNKNWNISAGINYRTGQPTSVPLANNEIIDNTVNFDHANNDRLADYLRIDASALFKFKINNTFRSELGASIWNISNRKNLINNFFRINDSNQVEKFIRLSLGLTTNAVLRIYF